MRNLELDYLLILWFIKLSLIVLKYDLQYAGVSRKLKQTKSLSLELQRKERN